MGYVHSKGSLVDTVANIESLFAANKAKYGVQKDGKILSFEGWYPDPLSYDQPMPVQMRIPNSYALVATDHVIGVTFHRSPIFSSTFLIHHPLRFANDADRFFSTTEIKTEEDLVPPGAKSGTVPSDIEQATGLERLELVGKMQGIDIFDMRPLDASRKGTLL